MRIKRKESLFKNKREKSKEYETGFFNVSSRNYFMFDNLYYSIYYGSAFAAIGAIIFATILIIITAVAWWKIFIKMGLEGWQSLVPGYNLYLLYEKICGNGLYALAWLASFIPVVGNVIAIILGVFTAVRLCKCFNKSNAFIVGMVLVGFIFELILAFDDSTYSEIPPYDINEPLNFWPGVDFTKRG